MKARAIIELDEMPVKLSPAEQMVADAEKLLQQAREALRKKREES